MPFPHCHCDYHEGDRGCAWGNAEFIRRLTEHWRRDRDHLQARAVAHALGAHDNLAEMTADEFYALPPADGKGVSTVELLLHSFVILPSRTSHEADLHDSGFRKMQFVGVEYITLEILGRFGACDNVSFDGIGGPSANTMRGAWQVECLPGSGLLHVWNNRSIAVNRNTLSTFEPLTRPQ